MEVLKGWLLLYLIGSLPLITFCAGGLSGWFYDYPLPLFFGILLVLAVPLVLMVMQYPQAHLVNTGLVWFIAVLLTLRMISPMYWMEGSAALQESERFILAVRMLVGIATVTFTWALIWTLYFLRSERVHELFA